MVSDKQREIREKAQEEIKKMAQDMASIKRIENYSYEEANEKVGLTWSSLSSIYFRSDEKLENITKLKDELGDEGYLAVLDEEENEVYLEVSKTSDLDGNRLLSR